MLFPSAGQALGAPRPRQKGQRPGQRPLRRSTVDADKTHAERNSTPIPTAPQCSQGSFSEQPFSLMNCARRECQVCSLNVAENSQVAWYLGSGCHRKRPVQMWCQQLVGVGGEMHGIGIERRGLPSEEPAQPWGRATRLAVPDLSAHK